MITEWKKNRPFVKVANHFVSHRHLLGNWKVFWSFMNGYSLAFLKEYFPRFLPGLVCWNPLLVALPDLHATLHVSFLYMAPTYTSQWTGQSDLEQSRRQRPDLLAPMCSRMVSKKNQANLPDMSKNVMPLTNSSKLVNCTFETCLPVLKTKITAG